MSFPIVAVLDAVVSHAMALGRFEQVNAHEPKNAPGNGLTCAVWVDGVQPTLSSGLSSTSTVFRLNVRIFSNMLKEPQDMIDPEVMFAVDELFAAYIGDFTLGGLIRNVDVRGQAGVPLSAQAGYINQDQTMLRVVTITLPLIVNDAWDEEA